MTRFVATIILLMAAALGAQAAKPKAKAAQAKATVEDHLELAEAALADYRIADAEDHLHKYRKTLKVGRKTLPDASGDLAQRIDRTANMLQRVEKIEVIDSMVVDADEFWSFYKLSRESGRLESPDALPNGFTGSYASPVYTTEDGGEIFWAAPDKQDNLALFNSTQLLNEAWEKPHPLGDALRLGGDASFPFMMPDGITLYYASDSPEGLGGYDIYISRRNDDGEFLQPQNVGMPYNSPDDDYLLAIDELTGLGWWATDRNHIEGKVTIYMFIPSDLRVNVDPDSPDLIARAKLSSIKATQPPRADYSRLRRRLADIDDSDREAKAKFHFYMPKDRVITDYDQLRNPQAQRLLQRFITLQQRVDEMDSQLASLRSDYAIGNHTLANQILDLEMRLENERINLKLLSNQVISKELNIPLDD